MTERHRLSDLIIDRLTTIAAGTVAGLPDDETGRAVQAALADDLADITANADPAGPAPRLAYRWAWDDAPREREAARSLVVAVDVLHRDSADRFELGAWRVRDLCTADGTPVDCAETLAHLKGELQLDEVPDDPAELFDAPTAHTAAAQGTAAMSADEARDWYRLAVAALTPTGDGERACCRGRGDRVLSRVHHEAHLYVDQAAPSDPAARAEHRGLLVAELRALGRAA